MFYGYIFSAVILLVLLFAEALLIESDLALFVFLAALQVPAVVVLGLAIFFIGRFFRLSDGYTYSLATFLGFVSLVISVWRLNGGEFFRFILDSFGSASYIEIVAPFLVSNCIVVLMLMKGWRWLRM